MSVSIAFLIFRMNCYRLLAPAIEAALRRGWHVECWLDLSPSSAGRPKDVPSITASPSFKNGSVVFREYADRAQALDWIREKRVDAVVGIIPLMGMRCKDFPAGTQRSLYVCMEPSNVDWIYHVSHPDEISCTDLFALTTPHWLEVTLQILSETPKQWFNAEIAAEIRKKTVFVGWPEADQRSMVNAAEVRQKWGIPADVPVVVYLNWPTVSYLGLRLAWFSAVSLKKKVEAILHHRREWAKAAALLREPNLQGVTQAVRKFCDRNGAYLIVKHRHRDQIHAEEADMADLVIADETYYPHTIFELMSIASLSVGYYSFAVREAVASGVPYLTLDVAGLADIAGYGECGEPLFRRMSRPGDFFNSPGVAWLMDGKQILKELPSKTLADFRLDTLAQTEYYAKYLGIPGVANADVFLNAVQELLDKEGRSFSGRN
jgi:hypothetical protein